MAPKPLTAQQHRQIDELLHSGATDSNEIARTVGVTRQQVAAIKAWITMNQAEQIEEANELKFGLEADLQNALRENIDALESGLQIDDHGKERTVGASVSISPPKTRQVAWSFSN